MKGEDTNRFCPVIIFGGRLGRGGDGCPVCGYVEGMCIHICCGVLACDCCDVYDVCGVVGVEKAGEEV